MVAGLLVSWTPPSAKAAGIYWTYPGDQNTIGHANLDGTGVNSSFITGSNYPYGIAVDGTFVYWSNSGSNSIGRANLDGSGVNQNFITDAGAITSWGLAVDGNSIYWTTGGSIGRANLDGTGVNPSFITGAVSVSGIAVDGTSIYWGSSYQDDQGMSTFGRANLDGTGVDLDFITGTPTVAIAVAGNFIYWPNFAGSYSIARANLLDKSVNLNFISLPPLGFAHGIAADGSFLYWGDIIRQAIVRANLDGTGVDPDFIRGPNAVYAFGLAVSPPVPEPATGLLMMMGLLGLAYRRRRHARVA